MEGRSVMNVVVAVVAFAELVEFKTVDVVDVSFPTIRIDVDDDDVVVVVAVSVVALGG